MVLLQRIWHAGACAAGVATAQELFLASSSPPRARQCALEEATDHAGGEYKTVTTTSPDDCCQACSSEAPRCVLAVHFAGVCYLKDVDNGASSKTGAVTLRPGTDPSTTVAPSPACTVLEDTDYTGGDYKAQAVDSADECCSVCGEDDACRAGVFFQGVCYLKNNIALAMASAGRVALLAGVAPTPSPTPSPTPVPPFPSASVEWKIKRGSATEDPQILLNVGEGFAPFQLRGVDYSPISTCCSNNDASVFQPAAWSRDLPRVAAAGVNVLKLYGLCDGVLDGSNACGAPEPGCDRRPVSVADVVAFLNAAYEHRVFVLLANRANPGNVEAYEHLAATYGAHPAVAGVLMYDETVDLGNFNAAARAVHENLCRALGKDPAVTATEDVGRIVSTAAQGQILDYEFQSRYGEHINVWGWDPYYRWEYDQVTNFSVPFKPYVIMENGLNGASNAGCRNDCGGRSDCTACSAFDGSWRDFVAWMDGARLGGHVVFEWTDEHWKGNGDPCAETLGRSTGAFDEANHGLFRVLSDGSLEPKSIGDGASLDSVLAASWTKAGPGAGGFYGWL